THPRGAPGDGGPDLASPQPITARERRTLGLREWGVVRGEGEQGGYEAIEEVDAAHVGQELIQRDGTPGEIVRDRVRDIHADAHRHPLQRVSLPPALTQDPRDLAIIDQYVV